MNGLLMRLTRLESEASARYVGEVVQHEIRVGAIVADFAAALEMPPHQCAIFQLGGRFHDIGKLRVPLEILLKPGLLDADERHCMKRHTIMGAGMLKDAPGEVLDALRDAIRYHHERWDGRGYEGIVGDAIPEIARMVCIADVYDALTTNRSYRTCSEEGAALLDMTGHSEGMDTAFFDPSLLRRFVKWRCEVSPVLDRETIRTLRGFAASKIVDPSPPLMAIPAVGASMCPAA